MNTFLELSPMAEYLNKNNATRLSKSIRGTKGNQRRYYLHIDFGIKQFVQGLFAGGVPYWHLKVLGQDRTNHLIQDQEQEIPASE
jgi:hypothetical protein